jgi:uncharacterized protein YbjT (DUF2867 family)
MRKKIFAIMGATGHIGHVVVEELLKRGHAVRAIGRSEHKLHELEIKGASSVITEFDNTEMLTQAFTDCYAVFTLIPPSYHEKDYAGYQDHISNSIVQAIKNSGVTRVVNLSSMGANLAEGTGPISGLHRNEKRLNSLQNLTTLIHFRPTYFMENLDDYIPTILGQQVICSPLDKDAKLPMVACRDIGWKAADFLDSTQDFGILVFEFVGPKAVTMQYVAECFGKVLDMPEVHYEQVSFDDAKQELLVRGISENLVDSLLEMYRAFNAGWIQPSKELTLTHRGATTIEAYIQHLGHKLFAHQRP